MAGLLGRLRLWWTPLPGFTISEANPQSWLLAVERDDRRDARELELEERAA